MKALKFIFTLALAVIFVVTTFLAVFGLGKVIDQVLKSYVFGIENCTYPYAVYPEVRHAGSTSQKAVCEPGRNEVGREVAEGLSMFLVGLPVAIVAFRETKKSIREQS